MREQSDGKKEEYEEGMSDIPQQCRLTQLEVCKHRFCLVWMHICAAEKLGDAGRAMAQRR